MDHEQLAVWTSLQKSFVFKNVHIVLPTVEGSNFTMYLQLFIYTMLTILGYSM